MKMGEESFRTGNNRHEGCEVFIEHLLVSRNCTRCYVYVGELPLSWHL